MRQFDTGATRNDDSGKVDFEGFLSPTALQAFGRYMHKNRHLPDGSMRASDNWQSGIPLDSYMKSMLRHLMDVWLIHRSRSEEARTCSMEEALCGLMFNVHGYLHEITVRRFAAFKPEGEAHSSRHSHAGKIGGDQ